MSRLETETKVVVSYSNYGKSPIANMIEVSLTDNASLKLTYDEEESEVVVIMEGQPSGDNNDGRQEQTDGAPDNPGATDENEAESANKSETNDDSFVEDEAVTVEPVTIAGRIGYDDLVVLVKCLSQMKNQIKSSNKIKTEEASKDCNCGYMPHKHPGTCGINGKDFHSGIIQNKGLKGNEYY